MVPQQQRRRRRRVAIPRASERRLVVARGVGGFGFTIAGQRPCVVSAVAAGGPAERAGLRAGDALLAVDGASVARAPHASVARLVAGAPGAIALSVSPRDSPPTDTEDTEPDERARTRRRHPPPRRRPQPLMHHPACVAAPSTSGVNEILQNISRAQLTADGAARLECRAVVGYLGTIDTPRGAAHAVPANVRQASAAPANLRQASAAPANLRQASAAPANVRHAVRKLRQERRTATPVLLSVQPNYLLLRRTSAQILAQYQRERIIYAGCGSDADRRYFGLVTSAETAEDEASVSCHVFAVDPRMTEHDAHINRAREFQIACTSDPVAERCLEFPPSAEYVVGVIRGMYSLPSEECTSPNLQISKLIKGDSPAMGNFSRNNAVIRPRERRPCRHDDVRADGDFVANSPQPSNHSEITTTSSNSDSGIGFHNDGRNIAERILVVDFAGVQPAPRFRADMPRRPAGLVGCSFDEGGSFLSNTTPVVDGFGGQGRPLNLDDVIINANDMQTVRHVSPKKDDNYNYNLYGNVPTSSRYSGVYDQVYTENEGHYELIPVDVDLDVAEAFNSVEIYEESRRHPPDWQSNESVENVTVISGGTSKASMDSVSMYSSRSHEEARPITRKHLQASLDDMLVIGLRDPPKNDDHNFVRPAAVKCKVRKSTKPLNLLSKTKNMLSGKERQRSKEARRRSVSASAGDVCDVTTQRPVTSELPAAASEPDLRDTQSEQSSPFRRWTTGSGAGSSYRHHDHRNMYNKQMSEGCSPAPSSSSSNVARWSLGLEHLLADPAGFAAFAHFLRKEFAAENIRFWLACEQYQKTSDDVERAELAGQIWQRYLSPGAEEPVNVDAAARRHADLMMHQRPPPLDLFQQAQNQIFNLMKLDSYRRFLNSATHSECARADLCGLPPPYKAVADQPNRSPLKKSASNVSERRRSGGASLLPWKTRREAPRDNPPPVTDVVKCSQSVAGQALCRVLLPDGAASVVSADGAETVAQLVQRLLHKRNIAVSSYDVTLKDPAQGETPTVNLEAMSSVLSGREAVVERRSVVRLELVGDSPRCVLVKCGGSRRLEHVLRRVAAKYRMQHVCATRDAVPLSPDTIMQDLDGCRLRVTEASSAGGGDSDGESLCELALRLHDQDRDTQSNSTSSSFGSCGGATAAGGGAGAGARVRAELRAGAALHHHPPDFLENLRETQRRLLPSPAPEPRTPPPLPPKPQARPPTLV